ncbi:MAG: GDSL family lipase [Proteobacteria bacterium SG_bin9]|nr:MAG: GDSL family lipase [Proteobacteria bacterium SG_bin9]
MTARCFVFDAGPLAAAAVALSVLAGSASALAQGAAAAPASPAPEMSASVDPGAQKGTAGRAIDRVREAAKTAGDVFSRVPCSTPKSMKFEGSLPRIAKKLAAGEPVTIVAFGSSSTAGYGASSSAFSYPNRLADQLRRKYPDADISILNQGVGGEDGPQMIARLQKSVIDNNPDLVIWQLGTNTVVKGGNIEETAGIIEDGVKRLKETGADVVLVDPQYAPATMAKEADANKMVALIKKAGHAAKVGVFPRFKVMQEWHKDRALPMDQFVISDGLHMNDWGYACFAQLLGDTIIKTVGQVKAGVEVPSNVLTFRPM